MIDRVRFFEEAAEEIEHARRWYRRRSESAEASLLRELDHAVDAVLNYPHMWPRHMEETRRYVFPKFPFSLVYFVEDNVVLVVALEAENKEPGYWRDRMPKPR